MGQLFFFQIQLPRSLCWSVVPSSYATTPDYGRKQNNYNLLVHAPRSSAEYTRNEHGNINRLLPCVPRSRKLPLLLLLLLLLLYCNLRIRNIMYDWSLNYIDPQSSTEYTFE